VVDHGDGLGRQSVDMARIRFGTFDFDSVTLELRREGTPVRLQAQPARVLSMLLARPGEMVTRESLQRAVWGEETYVDFDRGLNFCIGQIRSALRDSAESPRFVQTVPKSGYRFIAPVRETDSPLPGQPQVVTAQRTLAEPRMWWALLLALVIAAAAFVWSFHSDRTKEQVSNVAITRFDNETGDADFDRFADGLTDSVVADLTGSAAGRYGVIGNASILRQPRSRRDLIAIGSALHARYVILGQVRRIPSGISVLAHLIRLPQQTHVRVARIDSKAGQAPGSESELARRIVADLSPAITRDADAKAALHTAPSY